MTLQEILNSIQSKKEEGRKFLDAKDFEKAENVKAEIVELEQQLQAEIMFMQDDNSRNLEAKAQMLSNAQTINNGNQGTVVNTFGEQKPKEKDSTANDYLNAWAKVMMGQKINGDEELIFDKVNSEFKNATQTAATHAVVIPETVASDIWKEAEDLFPILRDVNMTYVPGDFTIIKETNSGADAAWYDEKTEVADGEFGLGELNLTGCELAKAIPISWKLRKMSIEKFIPYITSLLAEKMGAALAKGVVSGKGKPGAGDTFKPEPKGIITAIEGEAQKPQVVSYSESDDLNYDKIAQAMGKIKSSYKTGAAIYAKSTVIWNKLALLKDSMGRPLFIPDVTSGGIGRMFGLPVKEEDSVPEDAILFGNVARGYAANVNENMTIYTEDHVKQRYTDYMSYSIVDGDVLSTKAFALIKKAATV
ncbi:MULTISPECIES: phage major capsid protein [Bacillus cereus group]|uniref:ATP-dependent Clp protease proteolytic subunit n=1 Tax=Bacillus thuringiensis TaxID=1428 RepID=A0A1C4FGK3_BACTU|nr:MULTISPECIES: phage major capsid protein [Bacillus cereus group]MED3026150.1 phage major capsid protein [Bacillus wiedmannii]SCC55050.1 ATP-dependent Clp protease proteolytic subunit [Bacillus thuringiensis]